MTILLVLIFIVLFAFIVFLSYKMNSERNAFASKLQPLEQLMLQLNKDCKNQALQLQLTDELKHKMKEVNAALNRNIFDLNYQLFDELHSKKE